MKMTRHRTSLAVKFALGGILVVLFISVINMQVNLNNLRQERTDLQTDIDNLRDDIEEINHRLSEETNAAYIERYAREKYFMQGKNEQVFIVE